VGSAFRAGEAAEWAEARKLEPNMLLLGNVDSDLSSVEYKGQLNLALLECLTGQSWSLETWGGWTQMMSRYLGWWPTWPRRRWRCSRLAAAPPITRCCATRSPLP